MSVQLHTWLNWGTLPAGLLIRGKCHGKLGAPILRSPLSKVLGPVSHIQGNSGQAGAFLRKTGLLWVWCGWWHQSLGPKEQAWESQGWLGCPALLLGEALPCLAFSGPLGSDLDLEKFFVTHISWK